jgi:GAF domain-containing protein
VLAVPLRRDGRAIGSIGVWRSVVKPFTDAQVGLLSTFADQAVIAIENVRLFTALEARNRDLTVALERQTATSEILRVISQSQTDVQPVFDTIVDAVLRLAGAASANVFTYDGTLVHLAAMANLNPAYGDLLRPAFPRPPDRGYAVTRAILARDVVTIRDVLADAEYGNAPQSLVGGFRSVLAVPLLRNDEPIGAMVVGHPEPGPFPDEQVELLQAFADQAVIAIENVRLFRELQLRNRDLTEALEQQTATSEILRVISRSQADVQPVFDTIARAARPRSCGRFRRAASSRSRTCSTTPTMTTRSACTPSPAGSAASSPCRCSATAARSAASPSAARSPDPSPTRRSRCCGRSPTRRSSPSRTCACSTSCRSARRR